MSDTTPDNGQEMDRRRVLASLAAAFGVHVVLFVAFALGLGADRTTVFPPVTIELSGTEASAGAAGSSGAPGSSAGGAPGAAAAGSASVPKAATAASAPAAGSQSSDGFVIPTPRAQPIERTASSAGGPSFREAGGRTGAAKGIPSVPGPAEAPAVPPVQQGRGSGSASTAGAGASAAQRSGTGVLVPGASGPASDQLDLGALDKALAGGGAGKPGARGSGGAGGSGTGSTGSGGTGGSGGAGTGSGTGTGQGFNVQWGSPDAGKGRTLVFSVKPTIPKRVLEQGLTLSVKVSFTVLADGLISAASIEQSSGDAEVDARVMEAIRMCRFNSVPGVPPAKGSIPYLINPR
jgi:TonB family protein